MADTTLHDASLGTPSATAYRKGCRCQTCRDAANMSVKRYRLRKMQGKRVDDDNVSVWKAWVPIKHMMERGMTLEEISRLSNVPPITVRRIYNADYETTTPTIYEKLKAAERSHARKFAKSQLVDAEPFNKLVDDWHARGLSYAEMSRISGIEKNWFSRRTDRIHAETAAKVMRMRKEAESCIELGLLRRSTSKCIANGTIPKAQQPKPKTPNQLIPARYTIAHIEAMLKSGLSYANIAERTGLHADSVRKITHNAYVRRSTADVMAHARKERDAEMKATKPQQTCKNDTPWRKGYR